MENVATPYARLEEAREHMKALARHSGEIQRDCGLALMPDDFCKEVLKFGLMEASLLLLDLSLD